MKLSECSTAKCLAWLCAMAVSGHSGFAAEPGKFPPPVKVTNPAKEADLATLTLTPEAEKRLGIETAPVERRKLKRSRVFGGEIILPARQNGAGSNVSNGQSVFTILPSLSPAELVRLAQSQIDGDGQVEQAKVQLDAAKTTLARAEQLLRDKAGTARAVDEARAQVGLAEAGLRTAQARRDLLGPPVLDVATPPVCWVRVPIYVGETAKLDSTAEAGVGGVADAAAGMTRPARPVSAPPSANAAAATVDWFYEVSNTNGALQLGQRVGVTVPLRADEESLVVPWTAVVHDAQGGTWVYEKSGPLSYTRRRVQVKQVVDQFAALTGAVKPGARVVVTGVAELFGAEFGAGK
ncbi:MAG TPA: membrane fusion protein MtrC [Verrucomicrobiae bacterium]|nr:membrane fusion protein MtrC [Verrucomicrobiae bacterium]